MLDFPGMEAGPPQADTACRGIRLACDVSLASVGTAHDDTAQCRQRSADSLISCTSSECVVPPKPRYTTVQEHCNNYRRSGLVL